MEHRHYEAKVRLLNKTNSTARLYCKTGRESWKRGTDTAADARAAARQRWSSRRLEGLPGAHKEGPKCWEGKSVCQEMIPTMGCGELERESSSQEVTKTPRGGHGGGEQDHSPVSSSDLRWAWETAVKSRVTF